MAGRRAERKEKLRRKAEELIEQLLEWEEKECEIRRHRFTLECVYEPGNPKTT